MSSFRVGVTAVGNSSMASAIVLVRIDSRVEFVGDVVTMRAGSAAFAVVPSVS